MSLRRTTRWTREALLTTTSVTVLLVILAQLDLPPPAPPSSVARWGIALLVVALLVGYWPLARLLADRGRHVAAGDLVLLTIGVALDLGAVVEGLATPTAKIAITMVTLWSVPWLGWQLILLAALARHSSEQPARDRGRRSRA